LAGKSQCLKWARYAMRRAFWRAPARNARIVDRPAAAEPAKMLADNGPVPADHNAIGLSLDLDRASDGARGD
jgi:hypothetical protein